MKGKALDQSLLLSDYEAGIDVVDSRLGTHSRDLKRRRKWKKNARCAFLFASEFTAFPFRLPLCVVYKLPFFFLPLAPEKEHTKIYAWAILFYAILWHERNKVEEVEERKKKLLIFTLFCLFLLFHFLLIASTSRQNMLERECWAFGWTCAMPCEFSLMSAPNRRQAARLVKLSLFFSSNSFGSQGRHSSAACFSYSRPGEPIMIINYVAAKPCRESHSLSRDLLDLYHLKSQRSLGKQSIIFHRGESSRRWCHMAQLRQPSCQYRNHNEVINSKCVQRNPPMMINVINQTQEIKRACMLQGVRCGCVTLFLCATTISDAFQAFLMSTRL